MGLLEGAIPVMVPHLFSHLSHLHKFLQLWGGSVVKIPLANTGDIQDLSSIPGSGRAP